VIPSRVHIQRADGRSESRRRVYDGRRRVRLYTYFRKKKKVCLRDDRVRVCVSYDGDDDDASVIYNNIIIVVVK